MARPAPGERFRPRGDSLRGGAVILVLATALWGSSFVVIKQILPGFPAAPICTARFAIAAIALSPFIRLDRKSGDTASK